MITPSTLIHATAGASFALYVLALLWRLRRPSACANGIWTAAFVMMVIHVGCAFHFAHHWSHRAAYDETAWQTAEVFGLKWGGGVFANYALLVVWAIEVANWWRGRTSRLAQVFLAFMWFNGAVVFGHGLIRWGGVGAFVLLAVGWWRTGKRSDAGRVV